MNTISDLHQLRKSNKSYIALLLSFLTLLCFSCSNPASQQKEPAEHGIQSYKVLALQSRSATLNTDYPASIQGLQNIEIRPKVDGFIEKIFVDEGSIVKKGQLLFKINAPQYQQEVRTAEAGIRTAESDINTARLQVEKVKPLVEKDIISHYELELAQNTLESKQAAMAQAQAALENARVNLGYTTITSPVDGVIGSLPYKLGSLVTGSTTEPLTTVYNTATVYAYFAMNEKQLLDFSNDSTNTSLQFKINHLPRVTLILSNGAVYEHNGKVETVNGQINTATGSANFRAAFINPKGLLHSGSSATVRVPTVVKSGIIIPQNVTYQLQDKRFAYVVDSQHKIKNVVIDVMDNTPGQFFVVTSGLNDGDKIVIESVSNLKDGTEIKPVDIDAASVYKDLK